MELLVLWALLTFSQTFRLEDKCSFPLSTATSELSDFADFPLPRRMRLYPFSPSSCWVAAACQCKQFPLPPCQCASEAREQRRLHPLQGMHHCCGAGAASHNCKPPATRIFGARCQGDGPRASFPTLHPCWWNWDWGRSFAQADFAGMVCVGCTWAEAGLQCLLAVPSVILQFT